MKAVVVTGATSGIGFAVCRELMAGGYAVLGVGRSPERCQKACEALREEFPGGRAVFFCGDLLQQREVRRLAGELRETIEDFFSGRLYALVSNAGCVRSWYSTTEDGFEQQFALNHLAGFLLTHELLPCLLKGSLDGGGRVLLTSSASHKGMRMRWDDLMFRRRYHPLLAYKQSKLCNMLFAQALNERFARAGLRAYGIDPGLVNTDIGCKQTGGLVSLVWSLRKRRGVSPEVPARTYAWILDQPEAPEGLSYCRCGVKKTSRHVNRENADRLFEISERLCGIQFGVVRECL